MRGVTLEAKGRSYVLRFTTNAICKAETEADRAIGEIAAGLSAGETARLSDLRLLIWAGIGNITKDAAGEIIDELGMAVIGAAVSDALRQAFPVDDGEPGNGQPA
jgi:hypothetical protein